MSETRYIFIRLDRAEKMRYGVKGPAENFYRRYFKVCLKGYGNPVIGVCVMDYDADAGCQVFRILRPKMEELDDKLFYSTEQVFQFLYGRFLAILRGAKRRQKKTQASAIQEGLANLRIGQAHG